MDRVKQGFLALICLLAGGGPATAQNRAEIRVNTAEKGAVVPSTLHGIFFEEISHAGLGAGNLQAALNDAVYVMSMEKNADLVKMSSYAPLLVNEHDVDWPVNLIHFNAGASGRCTTTGRSAGSSL
ncbi:alpha-L-arabinofuranosidase C-terminal domain-containing protein [Chitinophaga sp.]|uniref:alpha-L-arabinofuranosidase C-terminal domain-containing protein n=1 Tax=Chitinophaga sp. TaxID=1869181 RepID=UPI002C4ED3ED|nr:alpha-L-arabinofuranosidase C-terminal domain-containing protein [Chitinophaga sp.]HWV65565.1 alpha-L-arabinofuranosidase C-terminal domain-containing protein [Chitinophaga sp.]